MEKRVLKNYIISSYQIIFTLAFFAIIPVQNSLTVDYFLVSYLIFILIGCPISLLILKERLNALHLLGFKKLKEKKIPKKLTTLYLICTSFWPLEIHFIIFVYIGVRRLTDRSLAGFSIGKGITFPASNDLYSTIILSSEIVIYIFGFCLLIFCISYRSYLKKLDINKNIKDIILPLEFSI